MALVFSWVPRWVRWILPLVLVAAAAAFVLSSQRREAEDAWVAARGISPWLLVLASLAQFAGVACQVQLMLVVLPRSRRPTLSNMARVEATTMAVSHTVPGGTAAGTAVAYRLLTQDMALAAGDVGFALAIRGVGSAVVLNAILWVALVVSLPGHGFQPVYTVAAALGIVLIGALGAGVWLLMRGGRRTERVVMAVTSRLPVLDPDAVVRVLRDLADRVGRLVRDRRLALAATAWSAGYWLLSAASLWIFIAALGATIRADELFVAFGIANVLAVLPITPRGLGLVEGVLIPSLVGFGVPLATAAGAVIAWRLVSFWLPIPLGGLAYASLRLDPGRTAADREAERDAVAERLRATSEDVRSEVGSIGDWARKHGLRPDEGSRGSSG